MDTPIIIYTEKEGKEESFLFVLNEDGSSTLQQSNDTATKNFTVLGSGVSPIINLVVQSGSSIQVTSPTEHITDAEQCIVEIVNGLERTPLGTIEQDIPLNIGDILVIFEPVETQKQSFKFKAENYVGKIVAIDAR